MTHDFNTPPSNETTPEHSGGLDAITNDEMFTLRKQLKREAASIASRLKALDEDIRPAMLEGEQFADDHEELYILSVETTTCDWKSILTSGVLTPEQIAPYLKRTVAPQIRTRKVEASAKPVDPATAEGAALRDRIANASARLTG